MPVNAIQVFNQVFDFSSTPTWVQYQVRLRAARWGATNQNFDTSNAPVFVRFAVNLYAKRWATRVS